MPKIAITLFIAMLVAVNYTAYAHHNSELPEGVNPGWVGLELYSNHNEAIEHAESMRNSTNEMNSTNMNQTGSATMNSNQAASQSGDNERERVLK